MDDNDMQAIHLKLDRILALLGEAPNLGDTDPLPAARTSWRHVGLAYRARFLEAKRGQVLDYHIQRHQQSWEDLARVLDGYPDPMRALSQALDSFFLDKWARDHGFPPNALLKAFERYHSPPVIASKDEPNPEAINAKRLRERQQDRELHEKLAGHGDGAVKPPDALDAMLAGIGQKVGSA